MYAISLHTYIHISMHIKYILYVRQISSSGIDTHHQIISAMNVHRIQHVTRHIPWKLIMYYLACHLKASLKYMLCTISGMEYWNGILECPKPLQFFDSDTILLWKDVSRHIQFKSDLSHLISVLLLYISIWLNVLMIKKSIMNTV